MVCTCSMLTLSQVLYFLGGRGAATEVPSSATVSLSGSPNNSGCFRQMTKQSDAFNRVGLAPVRHLRAVERAPLTRLSRAQNLLPNTTALNRPQQQKHKLRVTAFCALRNILRHTGSVTEHRDGTHHSLHNFCSVFTSRCTGFGMPCPVLYLFLKYRKFIYFTCSSVFISGVVMFPCKTRRFLRRLDQERLSSFSVRVHKKA